MAAFPRDDEAMLRGVLQDLVDSGLVFRSGSGDATVYRAATVEELAVGDPKPSVDRLAAMLWVMVNRYGPIADAELSEHVQVDQAKQAEALASLLAEGRLRRDTEGKLVCDECVIPHGDPAGWEAAVFDHFQALVTAICTKLRLGSKRSLAGEWVGGSTYGFDVWDGHPHRSEVLGFLQSTRERAVQLRRKIEDYNARHTPPDGEGQRVIAYVGQTVVGIESTEEESS
jgi:hypothetical protein